MKFLFIPARYWKDALFIHILHLPFWAFEHFCLWTHLICIIKIIIKKQNKTKNINNNDKTKRYVIKPYRLTLSCTIPSTLLQGSRNYIATFLTKLPQKYSLLYQHIGFIVCCSYVIFICMLCFYPVALCIVVFCCFPSLTVSDILSASSVRLCSSTCIRGVCPCFGEVLSSCCIKALSLFFMLRLRLIFHSEVLSSCFIYFGLFSIQCTSFS